MARVVSLLKLASLITETAFVARLITGTLISLARYAVFPFGVIARSVKLKNDALVMVPVTVAVAVLIIVMIGGLLSLITYSVLPSGVIASADREENVRLKIVP